MLIKSTVAAPEGPTQPSNNSADLNDFRFYLADDLLTFETEACKRIFIGLVQHIDIKEIEKLPFFIKLQDKAHSAISPKEAFDLATFFVVKNKRSALEFLLKICQHDLLSMKTGMGNTLLHIACMSDDRQEVISCLLQNKFKLNVENSAGKRPLHYLVMFDKNSPLLSEFKKHGVDLNALDSNSMTSLHIAAIKQNKTCITELIKLKADTKAKYKGQDYRTLGEKGRKGDLEIPLPVFNVTYGPAEENIALYYKALFLDKFRQDHFKTCAASFVKKEALTTSEQMLFFYAYTLSTSLTAKNIKKFSDTYVGAGKKVDSEKTFLCTLQTVTKWLLTKKPTGYENTTDALNEMQLVLLKKMETPASAPETIDPFFPEQMRCYIHISSWYCKIHLPAKGMSAANRGLLLYPEKQDKLFRAALYYNLGVNQLELLDFKTALKSFECAFKLNANDSDIFRRYFQSLIDAGDYETAKIICATTTCYEYSKPLMLFAKYLSSELRASEALKELEGCTFDASLTSLFLDLQYEWHLKLSNIDKAFAIAKASFSYSQEAHKSGKDIHISNAIGKFLQACLRMKKYQDGLNFLNLCQIEYPRSLYIKTLLFIIYLKSGQLQAAEKLLNELSQLTTDADLLCNYWSILALHQNNFSETLRYLDIALKISPNSAIINLYKRFFLLLSLPENQEHNEANCQPEASPKPTEEETASSAENETEDLNSPENWDPKQIHIFCQEQKNNALLALQNSLPQTPQPKLAWKVGETVYREGDPDLFSLNSPLYPDHFVTIDRSLMFDKKYHQTLEKGLCNRATDKDGLKILCNTLSELKMVGINERLYTLKKYQNGNKYLLVLNETGNHLKIKRELKLHKNFEIIDVSSISENFLLSELSDVHSKSTNANSFSPVLTPTAKPTKSLKNNEEKDDKKDNKDDIASNSLGN